MSTCPQGRGRADIQSRRPRDSQGVGGLSLFDEGEGRGGYIITDKQPNQLTLNLAEGRVWYAVRTTQTHILWPRNDYGDCGTGAYWCW